MSEQAEIWVGVTSRLVEASGYDEPRNAVSMDWVNWCAARDFLPLMLPIHVGAAQEMVHRVRPKLLILTGGNDVVQKPDGDYSARRNEVEFALLNWADETDTPVLGVCRGMHLINNYFGGSVVPNLPNWQEHVATTHEVTLFGELARLSESNTVMTNSFHRQGLVTDEVSKDFDVTGLCADDGTVEAISHSSKRIIGIGWHPERPNPASALDNAIIRRLSEL